MFVGSCLEEYVIALLTFVAGDGIGKDDFVGVADMGFAGCVGDGGGDVVFLFFPWFVVSFFECGRFGKYNCFPKLVFKNGNNCSLFMEEKHKFFMVGRNWCWGK